MTATLRRLQHQRDEGEIDGFTLIEILVVIVVLGILAGVVLFALSGITAKSAVASCQADGATVSTAIADFNNQNAGTPVSMSGLLNGTVANGMSSYLQSWPNNVPHYAFELSANQLMVSITPAGLVDATIQANYHPYNGPSSCVGVN